MSVKEVLASLALDIPGLLAFVMELMKKGKPPAAAVVEAVQQRHPHLFGMGREDEAAFESLRQLLSQHDERAMLDAIVCAMHDYEERLFRCTLMAMDCGSEIVDKPVKNPAKGQPNSTKEPLSWENTEKDLRVSFLRSIASEGLALVQNGASREAAAEEIVERMRARRLITRSAAAKAALEAWANVGSWIKENVCEFFDVDELSEITLDQLASALKSVDTTTAAQINAYTDGLQRKYPDAFRRTRRARRLKRPHGVLWHMCNNIANVFRRN